MVAIVIAGCGAGYRRALTTDEVPAGTCVRQTLEAGESCVASARDYSVGSTVHAEDGDDVGGTLWFRWPLFDVAIDEREIRRGTGSNHKSLAGGIGTHLRPLIFWPRLGRYVDVVVNLGLELGFLKESRFQGRGDGYVGAAIDLFAPDLGPLRYRDTGVPGIRMGVRYTAFVEGWNDETTLELGLIWRWGVPVDLHTHWTLQRTGD